MRYRIFLSCLVTLLMIIGTCSLWAQNPETWTALRAEDLGRTGYMDFRLAAHLPGLDGAELSIEKMADVDVAQVGDTINYTIVVTNIGDVTLDNVTVTDPMLGIDQNVGSLASGEATQVLGSYTVTVGDLPGPVVNTATGDSDQTDPETAQESVDIASLTIEKLADVDIAQVGDTINYTITVTNTGSATLDNVTVIDLMLGINLNMGTLPPGQLAQFHGSYTVTEGDLPGPVVNTATGNSDQTGLGMARESVDIASLSIEKVADVDVAQVGDTINYTITVINTGSVTLDNVTVTDPMLGIDQNVGSLTSGQSSQVLGSYTVAEGDLPGPVVNTATGNSDQTDPETAQEIVDIASLSIEKVADVDVAKVGDTIHYTITVTNTGSVTLDNVTVTDPMLGINQNLGSLAPGEFVQQVHGSYTVTEDDLPGPVVNTATGDSDQTDPKTAQESVDIASLSIEKTADVDVAKVGDTINYTITVTNTGSVTLDNVTVTDLKLRIFRRNLGSLAPGNSAQVLGSYTVTEGDLPGPVVNTAIGDSDQTDPKTAQESVDIASLSIEKVADVAVAQVGGIINYTITVTNTGSATLDNVKVTDLKLRIFGRNLGSLAPGQSAQVLVSYTVTEGDLPGPIVNTAIGNSDQAGPKIAQESVDIASLSIEKVADVDVAKVGDTINYTITVTNVGNVTLDNVTVTDPMLGIDQNVGSLTSGQSAQVLGSYTVTEDDLPGPVVNTATGDSDQTDPKTAQESVDIASLGIEKVADVDAAHVGDTINYTITVTNTGSATLDNVKVTDLKLRIFGRNLGSLAPGQSAQVLGSYTVTEGDLPGPVVNTAIGNSDQAGPKIARETVYIDGEELSIAKVADVDVAQVGDTIHYTITVTNTGLVPLDNVTVTDPMLGIDQNVGSLASGQSAQVLGSYTVTEGDLPGPVVNTATGDSDQTDPPVEDSYSVALASLGIEKTGDAGPVKVGDTISYSITVCNSGGVTLTNVVVTDALLGINQTIPELLGGQCVPISGNYTVEKDDLPGPVVNTAIADSDQTESVEDSHEVPITPPEETITLAPLLACNAVDEEHTVTATVQNDLGDPVVNRLVTFSVVSGPHAGLTGNNLTDSNGQASFSYTGTSAGTDTIEASFVDSQGVTQKSNQVTKEWIELAELWSVEYRYGDPPPGYDMSDWPIMRVWLEVRVENQGAGDAYNVTASLNDNHPSNMTIIEGDVALGDIPAGGSAWSTGDTFTFELDMSDPQDPTEQWHWDMEYDDACGNHRVILDVPEFPWALGNPPADRSLPGNSRFWYPNDQGKPNESKLHPNYPNPFNPETWIPYQLTDGAYVEVRILSVRGQLVRRINLGYKEAGFYTAKEKAAHWDGRNEAGERVASGIYFYAIQAGDFTSIRKMIVAE